MGINNCILVEYLFLRKFNKVMPSVYVFSGILCQRKANNFTFFCFCSMKNHLKEFERRTIFTRVARIS